MKAKLILKRYNDCYALNDYREPSKGYPLVIAHSDDENFRHKLSKQNCDDIFGIIDVEKLIDEILIPRSANTFPAARAVCKEMFNKVIELNKDKVFTLEDMNRAMEVTLNYELKRDAQSYQEKIDFLKSLQQPTEIEVMIEMENLMTFASMPKEGENRVYEQPKLDSEGCIILKKI